MGFSVVMKIDSVAIVGAGAVGCYYGCRIVEAGGKVRFLLRGDYEAVLRKGFEVESVAGNLKVEKPKVYRDSAEMGPVDLVIVSWKATANEYAEEVIRPLLHKGTRILTLQTGLGNVELLEGLFGKGRVLGGLCFVCINRMAAGEVRHSSGGLISIGESIASGVLSEMSSLFGEKVEVKVVASLAEAQWRKLVWNIPFNGLCVTEGGIDTEELLDRAGKEEEVRELMQEVQATARALGYEISDEFIAGQIATTRKMGAYKPSSMLDYVNGFPLEVEAIWGEPVRRAEAAGVAVPRLRALYEGILAADERRL